MPTRRTKPKETLDDSNSISIRVPKISYFKDGNFTPILVVLLIVFSFLLGVLVTKVSYLEKGIATTNTGTNQAAPGASATPVPGKPVDIGKGHLPAQGDTKAKVTVIEFADFQCPFCEQWFQQVEPNLKKDYIDTGKVQFYFRHYAFLGQESTWAAEASECANEQDKFWDYHDYLYSHQGQENSGAFTKDKLEGFASDMGLDTAKFNDCLESDKYAKQVTDDQTEGNKAGVNGTPATFINGVMISGAVPYDQFKKEIDSALSK